MDIEVSKMIDIKEFEKQCKKEFEENMLILMD